MRVGDLATAYKPSQVTTQRRGDPLQEQRIRWSDRVSLRRGGRSPASPFAGSDRLRP